jgi:hypothetical protein
MAAAAAKNHPKSRTAINKADRFATRNGISELCMPADIVVVDLVVAVPAAVGVVFEAVGVVPAAVGVVPAAVGVVPAAVGVVPAAVGVVPAAVGVVPVAVGVVPLVDVVSVVVIP